MGYFILICLAVFFILIIIESKKKPEKTSFILTPEYEEILDLIKKSHESIFITGKAGTGKSTLLKNLNRHTNKNYVMLAPTGLAAQNIGGQTIHSFFRFPPRIITSSDIKPDYVRADLFKNLEMVVIDEVSMIRADLMHSIDLALRKNRNQLNEPFGGIQMIFIGDLFQLPPILKDTDRDYIFTKYGGQYFFDAPTFNNFSYHFKELTKVFRQPKEEKEFITLLNKIRINDAGFEDMVLLNSRHRDNAGEQENSIFLTTRNSIARNINGSQLAILKDEERTYTGQLEGKYTKYLGEESQKLEDILPAPFRLKLKNGAQIMMIKNDPGKRWVNGTICKVDKLEDEKIRVTINGNKYYVEKETWIEVEHVYNNEKDEIEEKIVSKFMQFPIRLAYAMTIHKSQGKTFEKITVDIGTGAFAHGQIYVALSRCTSLNGIILNNPIKESDIIIDSRIVDYYSTKAIPTKITEEKEVLPTSKLRKTIIQAIDENSSVEIEYLNFNGQPSIRRLSRLSFSDKFGAFGYTNDHVTAFCHLRNEERNFKLIE